MTTATQLRAAVIGLIGLAATEEEMLLASTGDREDGNSRRPGSRPAS
jgi:hypothetical protein